MATNRRNFLKAAGLTFGVVAAGGAAETILARTDKNGELLPVEDNPVQAHEKKTMFEMLYRNNRTPEQEIVEAIEAAPEVIPTERPPLHTPGDAYIPEIWAREALAILEESMVIGALVHRDCHDQVAQQGDVINVRKPKEFRVVRKTSEDRISIDEGDTIMHAVPLDQHFYSSFIIRDGEQCMSWHDISNIFIAPAMMAMARGIDMTLYEAMATSRSPLVVCPRGPQDTVEAVLNARQTMNEHKQFVSGRRLIVSPDIEMDLLRSDILVRQEDRQLTRMTEKRTGQLFGFDTFCDPSIQDGLAFHRDAVVLVNRPMQVCPEFTGVRCSVAHHNDLSVRCVMNYDVAQAGTRVTFDILGGTTVLDEFGICRFGRSKVYPGISILDEHLKTVKLG